MTPDQIYNYAKDFITTVGFPIAVAAYLLFVQNRTLKKAEEAIDRLTTAITVLTASLIDEHK